MSLTNYGEDQVLTMFKENMDQSSNFYYLALFTGDPGETGSTEDEVSGGSYARQPVSFDEPDGGTMVSADDIEFPAATAAWGTVTHWGLCDAATSGNVWWTGAITTPKSISSGDVYRIPAGYLTLTMD